MNVPVVSHLKLLVNLYNKMNNRFLVLLVIYLIIYLLSVLYKNKQIFCAILLSLLSWERGLKFIYSQFNKSISCRSSRGSVDWNIVYSFMFLNIFSRSSRGSVDWNRELGLLCNSNVWSLLSWERGLKYWSFNPAVGVCGRSSRGSVDWNTIHLNIIFKLDHVAPLVGAWIEILEF